MKFKSDILKNVSLSAWNIISREWDFNNADDSVAFFNLFISVYIDHHNKLSPLRPEQVACFQHIANSAESPYVPNEFFWGNVNGFMGYTGFNNNNILYNNRNKAKTVVVMNNHLTWYEAINGGTASNSLDIHYHKKFGNLLPIQDYNFISITEDLSRVNKNPMLYPSFFLDGADHETNTMSELAKLIKTLVPADEYIVYSICRTTMPSCLLSYELNATKMFIQHGTTSTISSNNIPLDDSNKFLLSQDTINLDNIMENLYFMLYTREQSFGNNLYFNDIFDLITKMPDLKIKYAYTSNPALSFMDPFVEYIKSKPHPNIEIENIQLDDYSSDLAAYWRIASKWIKS